MEKQVIRAIQTQPPLIIPYFLWKKREIDANFLDATLIRVAPMCHDTGGPTTCIVVLLAKMWTLKSDKGMLKREKYMLKVVVSLLIYVPRMELCLVGVILSMNNGLTHLSKSLLRWLEFHAALPHRLNWCY
jgi:hypothetical protein